MRLLPTSARLAVLLALFIAAMTGGCSSPREMTKYGRYDAASGIRVTTRDNATFLFHDDAWHLTWSGISGTADVASADEPSKQRDTTLSYWDIATATASEGRGNTMTQFLLTILGVILIIGLAALILYAAFLATDK